MTPPQPPGPGITIPTRPGSASPSVVASVRPGSPATPLPGSTPQPCPSTPSDTCCGFVFGSLQGTITDEAGTPVLDARVTAKTTNGALLGGCTDSAISVAMTGHYAFNAVPWGVTVVIQAVAPGYAPFEATVPFPKGPIVTLNIKLKRP
ncbi:MAG: carboxypeptidase regulatory-like domain-containing protein [Candidatus Sericytochromatia bacterium]|nr:carboxypeptidase regulatory-like domain-containing protein [Candidatus Sericytochromatia bacterium]